MLKVHIGQRELEMDSSYLTCLRDSNDILKEPESLKRRLQADGYLLIRNFHSRELILEARKQFLHKLKSMGRLRTGTNMEEGIVGEDNRGAFWGNGASELKEDFPGFLDVVNHRNVMDLFQTLLDGPVLTYDYKWPRAIQKGGNTGAHYDVVYMGKGTKQVYTMWMPFGDIPYRMGPLALLLGSQHFEKVKQTYGRMDVDKDNVATGWISTDPIELVDQFGGQWATTEFQAGDIIIFGMFMMHASLNNLSDRYRISSDTRYQLASEPVDERWVGKKPKGHYAWGKTPLKSVADARKEWGL